MALPDESLAAAADTLGKAEAVALVCHVNPDADAMGSMLGIGIYLVQQGKRVTASWPNGDDRPPPWLEALPGADFLVTPGEMPKEPELLVTLDVAHVNRLGGLRHLVERAGAVICIDHHRTNEGFGSVNLIDPEGSSTAEIVFRLLERMGGELGPDVAACLWAGIVTDTGRFQYPSATPETLRVAARLREEAFDHARLAQALFADNSLSYLRLLGTVLARARHVPEADAIWTSLDRADLERGGVEIQETDDLIDILRTARESDVAAVLKEQIEGGYKVSLRSRGATDVAEIAARFGGGGHRLAAGYSSPKGVEETAAELLDALAGVRRRANA